MDKTRIENEDQDNRKYRVLINGENFLFEVDGKLQKTGFYTTRFVEARNPEEAEEIAIALIKEDPKLSGIVLNEGSDPAMLYAEEIEEVRKLEQQLGYAFYSEEGGG